MTTDNDVSITSEPPSSVSADNHSVNSNVPADLQALYNICMLCDEACSGCTGSDPAQCSSCANEYERTNERLGTCVKKTESNKNALIVGLAVGVPVGVVLIVIALLLCRRRLRGLHKRDALEPALTLDTLVLHPDLRKDLEEKEDGLPVTLNTTRPIYENVPRMPRPQSIEQGYDKVTRYTRDPTVKIRKPPQAESISVTEEESDNAAKPGKSSIASKSSDDNIQIDGEDGYVNTGFNDVSFHFSKRFGSTKGGSQRPSESAVYESIDGATKGPSKNQSKQEETEPRDSGMGASVCSDSEVDQSSSLSKNIVMNKLSSETPIFSASWQFFNNFSADGGHLQGPKSDVYLNIEKGAVLQGTNITIYGAVYTDLTTVHNHLNLPMNESIASPVVEYCASISKFESHVPMSIILPHFVTKPVSHESLKVYCFRHATPPAGFYLKPLRVVEKGDLKEALKDVNFNKSVGVYYFDNKKVCIWTAHFSGYVCTDCGKEWKSPEIQAEVHTKYTSALRLLDVRLDLWDSRFNIKDFKEIRQEMVSVNFAGMVLRDVKSLRPLKEDADIKTIALGTRLKVIKGGPHIWVHKQFDGEPIHPPENAIPVTALMPCPCSRARIPQRVDWQLTIATTNAAAAADDYATAPPLDCLVEVGYIEYSEHEDVPIPLQFLPRTHHLRIPLNLIPMESVTPANDPAQPMIRIDKAFISIGENNSGDQTPRQEAGNAERAPSQMYENLLGFQDRSPIPDSSDIERGNT